MLGTIFNNDRDYNKDKYDIKRAAEHIAKKTSENDKEKK